MARRTRLICSLLVGLALGFLTWIFIYGEAYIHGYFAGDERLGIAMVIVLSPGIVSGVITSGNVHMGKEWIVIWGNFVFYSALSYLLLSVSKKFRTKRQTNEEKPSAPKSNGPRAVVL